jgi:DNA modification methylase
MIEMWDSLFCNEDPSISYDLNEGHGFAAFTKMNEVLNRVWKECDRVLMDNGFVCINIGDATRTLNGNFQMYPNHAYIINFFHALGYSVLPDIHWRKPSNSPNKFMGSGMYPAGAYVTYEHEYILVFRKGGKRAFSGVSRKLRQKSAYFWEERNVWFSDLWEVKGANQVIASSSVTRNRNASYPFEIPFRLVNMYSAEGDTVLDPFAGLGTTNLACMVSNRNSIGVEIDEGIAALAIENIKKSPLQLNSIIDDRLMKHRAFIDGLSNDKQEKCYLNVHHDFKVKTKQEMEIKIDHIVDVSVDGNIVICNYQ